MSGWCSESKGSKSQLYPSSGSSNGLQDLECNSAFANNPELQRQLDWGNSRAIEYMEAVSGLTGLDPEGPQLFPELVGTCEYYDARHADFVRRNPDLEPPDYYQDYGKKYCERFSEFLFSGLSGAGQEWDITTRTNLQLAIERGVLADQQMFESMESDPELFREFAFRSHPDAYVESGLADLPITDMVMIGMTPDVSDLAGWDGLSQVASTTAEIVPELAIETLLSLIETGVPSWADVNQESREVAQVDAPGASISDAKDVALFQAGMKMLEIGSTMTNPDGEMPDLYELYPSQRPD